jgi:hypothetical protein
MDVNHHHFLHFGGPGSASAEILAALGEIKAQLQIIIQKDTAIMSALDDGLAALTAKVAALTTVDASVEALLAGIPAISRRP